MFQRVGQVQLGRDAAVDGRALRRRRLQRALVTAHAKTFVKVGWSG